MMCPIDIRCKRDNEGTKMVVIGGVQHLQYISVNLIGFPARAFER